MRKQSGRLMILGGGSSQISLLRRAVESGFSTVLADRDPHAPGRVLAGDYVPASTFDAEAVTAGAERFAVDAIVTAGTDQPVLTAAIASERLGLPFPIDTETALAVTNKRIMKARFLASGIPSAPYALVHEDDDEEAVRYELRDVKPPYVVKPVDSQGQRGVARAVDVHAVLERGREALAFSRERRYLVESYYPSEEITVSGWVCNGRTHLFSVTDRVTIERGAMIGVCVAHRFPSRHAGTVDSEIRPLVEAVVTSCGIRSGPIYFQLLRGERGFIVNEAACRLGGAYEDEALPVTTGHDIVAYLLASAREPGSECGAIASAASVGSNTPFSIPLLFANPGVVSSYHGADEARRLPGVIAMRFLLPTGTRIDPIRNSTQRIGYAVITGSSRDAVNNTVGRLFSTIAVRGPEGEDLLMDTAARCMIP